MTTRRRSARRIWGWPVLFAVLILFGLTSALLGQGGLWWLLSWTALAIPLLAIAICVAMCRRSAGSARSPAPD